MIMHSPRLRTITLCFVLFFLSPLHTFSFTSTDLLSARTMLTNTLEVLRIFLVALLKRDYSQSPGFWHHIIDACLMRFPILGAQLAVWFHLFGWSF
jgi:cyanate permease